MTTYTWQFPALDVYPSYQGLVNVVFQVHWRLTANDGSGHTTTAYGAQAIGSVDVTNFVPFASLTATIVQGWVEQTMGSDLNAVKSEMDARIAQQVSPTRATLPAPW